MSGAGNVGGRRRAKRPGFHDGILTLALSLSLQILGAPDHGFFDWRHVVPISLRFAVFGGFGWCCNGLADCSSGVWQKWLGLFFFFFLPGCDRLVEMQ